MESFSSSSDCEDLDCVNKEKTPQPYLFEPPASSVEGTCNASPSNSIQEDMHEEAEINLDISHWWVYMFFSPWYEKKYSFIFQHQCLFFHSVLRQSPDFPQDFCNFTKGVRVLIHTVTSHQKCKLSVFCLID